MDTNSYRLGQYKILEGINGDLWWESHAGLGTATEGRCFIEGNILIIGPTEVERAGFLKREFMEHLIRLPQWEKTEYYCLSHSIHKCQSGGRIFLSNRLAGSEPSSPNVIGWGAFGSTGHKETVIRQGNEKREYEFTCLKESAGEVWSRLKRWLNRVLR